VAVLPPALDRDLLNTVAITDQNFPCRPFPVPPELLARADEVIE
jgi:hypothetical protein